MEELNDEELLGNEGGACPGRNIAGELNVQRIGMGNLMLDAGAGVHRFKIEYLETAGNIQMWIGKEVNEGTRVNIIDNGGRNLGYAEWKNGIRRIQIRIKPEYFKSLRILTVKLSWNYRITSYGGSNGVTSYREGKKSNIFRLA